MFHTYSIRRLELLAATWGSRTTSDSNPTGDYWRRLPGKFERLSLTSAGHLLVINERGSVLKQLVKVMPVCVRRQSRSRCGTYPSRGSREVRDLEKTVTLDEWEVL